MAGSTALVVIDAIGQDKPWIQRLAGSHYHLAKLFARRPGWMNGLVGDEFTGLRSESPSMAFANRWERTAATGLRVTASLKKSAETPIHTDVDVFTDR